MGELSTYNVVTTLDDADRIPVVTDPGGTPDTNTIAVSDLRTAVGSSGSGVTTALFTPTATFYSGLTQPAGSSAVPGESAYLYVPAAAGVVGYFAMDVVAALITPTAAPGGTEVAWEFSMPAIVGLANLTATVNLYNAAYGAGIPFESAPIGVVQAIAGPALRLHCNVDAATYAAALRVTGRVPAL